MRAGDVTRVPTEYETEVVDYVRRVPAPPLDRFIDDIYCLTGIRITGAWWFMGMWSRRFAIEHNAPTRVVGVHFKAWASHRSST